MSTKNNNGYVSTAILSNNMIKEMRKHVEYEKFIARMLVDNDTTRQFKVATEEHPNSIHRFLYNNEYVDAHTLRAKNEAAGINAYTPDEDEDNAVR